MADSTTGTALYLDVLPSLRRQAPSVADLPLPVFNPVLPRGVDRRLGFRADWSAV